jgi:hypothetical protein
MHGGALVALTLAITLMLFQGLGNAGPRRITQLSGTVTDKTGVTDPSGSGTGDQSGPQDTETVTATQPASDSTTTPDDKSPGPGDSPGHTTPVPGPPDHASGSTLEVALGGNDLIDVGKTNAQVNDDGTSQGDVTVLAIGGQEIIGAHSDSEGEQSAAVDPFGPLCSGSGGAVCLQLLFADTNSSNTDQSAHSDATTQLAGACVGGSGDNAVQSCQSAPVTVGVSTNSSSIDRDKTTGGETATNQNDLADLCIGGRDKNGVCSGVGVNAVHSESTSSVDGNKQAQTDHSSYLANIQIGGQEIILLPNESSLIPAPFCPALLCVFANQSAVTMSTGVAGSRQEALHVDAASGNLALAHAGISESFVRWSTPTCCAPPAGGGGGPGGGGKLAFTGFGLALPLVVLTMLLFAAATLLAGSRRRLVVRS